MSFPYPIVECVVNVSEGRDQELLDALSGVIVAQPQCALLHRDTGKSAHRTVFTFAGAPDAVFAATYDIYKVCAERIDMRKHNGTHPRLGAVDVCPFVPISGITMQEVVARTQVLGARLGAELNIPVYLYEQSASAEHRKNLADIRRGEYEGQRAKSLNPEWRPDYGPAHNDRFGATVLGARPFLIAWNLNLPPTADLVTAKTIARRLRGSGYRNEPGLFPGLKAIGWHLEDLGRCQVSCNVVDPGKTNLARVYFTALNLAESMGTTITGSELIGLIPEIYLRTAGKAFSFGGNRADELATAVDILGLNDLNSFNLQDRVLEDLLARMA